MTQIIELTNLTKRYGSARGVEAVNLSITQGQIFGFLGPNGAGKSTTINILLDFIRPTSGSVKLFGLDARHQALEIHGRVGFLAGDMALDRNLSGWQQLEYLGHLRGSFDRSYISELAKRLDCNLSRKFKHLSRGNKQKVGLIAALMHKPDLLILDEPTSGLDPLMQAEFNKLVLEHKARGGTAFISSHMLSEVQEICDNVAFIRSGKIVATKTMEQLTKESPKQFSVSTPAPARLKKALTKLQGIHMKEAAGSLVGTYSGDVNELLAVLAKHTVTDMIFEDTNLEESFMKYYEDEEQV